MRTNYESKSHVIIKGQMAFTRVKNSLHNHVEEFFLQASHIQTLFSSANILNLQRFLKIKLLPKNTKTKTTKLPQKLTVFPYQLSMLAHQPLKLTPPPPHSPKNVSSAQNHTFYEQNIQDLRTTSA